MKKFILAVVSCMLTLSVFTSQAAERMNTEPDVPVVEALVSVDDLADIQIVVYDVTIKDGIETYTRTDKSLNDLDSEALVYLQHAVTEYTTQQLYAVAPGVNQSEPGVGGCYGRGNLTCAKEKKWEYMINGYSNGRFELYIAID